LTIDPEHLAHHARFVRAVALSLLGGDVDLAEDAAQEAVLVYLERPPKEKEATRAWLRTVVTNLVRMGRRKGGRRDRIEKIVARPEGVEASQEGLDRELLIRRMVDGVFSLPEPYRSTLVKRYYEDLTPVELARRSGVPVDTVKTRLKRGLRLLRERMDSTCGDEVRWRTALVPLLGLHRPLTPGRTGRVDLGEARTTFRWTSSKALVGVAALSMVVGTLLVVRPWPFAGERAATPRDSVALVIVKPDKGVPDEALPSLQRDLARTDVEEPLVPPSRPGALDLELRHPDGSPASRVRCAVVPDPDPRERRRGLPGQELDLQTDDDGRLELRALEAGSYRLHLDRAHVQPRLTVVAGQTTHHAVRLPPGVDIDGQVIDARARGVEGARVIAATHERDFDSGVCLAESDAAGRFSIRSLSVSRYLGARASGQAPSWMVAVPGGATESRQSLVLVLPGRAAVLEGRVVGEDLEPLEATILVEDPRPLKIGSLPDGTFVMLPSPERAVTGEDGSFRLDDLPGEDLVVVVSSPGHAVWRQQIGLEAAEERVLTVRLLRGGTISGRVVDNNEAPVPGARVRIVDSASGPPCPERSLQTDDRGRFEASHIAPGVAMLQAWGGRSGEGRAGLEVADGSSLEVTLRLDTGRVLSGRVVDDDGLPLAGLRVLARADRSCIPEGPIRESLVAEDLTDARGEFLLPARPDGPHVLQVLEKDAACALPLVQRYPVEPGEAVVLEVPRTARAGAAVRGRILHEDGEPLSRATIRAVRVGWGEGAGVVTTLPDGSFLVEGLSRGRYRLLVDPDAEGARTGRRPFTLGVDSLEQGEVRDLGTHRLSREGQMVARILRPEGDPPGPSTLIVRDAEGVKILETVARGDQVRVAGLSPGGYRLDVVGFGRRSAASHTLAFAVREGDTSLVDLVIEAGVSRRLRFLEPEGILLADRLVAEVIEDTGRVACLVEGGRTESGKLQFRVDLARGRYRVVATDDLGRVAQGELEVGPEPEAEPVIFHLR